MKRLERSYSNVARLDNLDLKIITLLVAGRPHSSYATGQKLGVSHGTIGNRFERLLRSGVIRISATVIPDKVGFPIQVLIGI